MSAKSDLLIEELVSAAVAFGREKEPNWQTRIDAALSALKAHMAEAHNSLCPNDKAWVCLRWIPVKEYLPCDGQTVIVLHADGRVATTNYLALFARNSGFPFDDITHWMPLPQPPEVQE